MHMATINMTIMGDPAWLGQSQFLFPNPDGSITTALSSNRQMTQLRGGNREYVWNPKLKCYNGDLADAITRLNFKFPTDINDKLGTYEIADDEQASFNGLYRVIQIRHNFSDGKYTNDLTMIRYNNQSKTVKTGKEQEIAVSDIDGSIVSGLETVSDEQKRIGQVPGWPFSKTPIFGGDNQKTRGTGGNNVMAERNLQKTSRKRDYGPFTIQPARASDIIASRKNKKKGLNSRGTGIDRREASQLMEGDE